MLKKHIAKNLQYFSCLQPDPEKWDKVATSTTTTAAATTASTTTSTTTTAATTGTADCETKLRSTKRCPF